MGLFIDSIDTPALTRSDLAELLFERVGLNKREARDFIDAFFDLIVSQLAQGQEAKISGFGSFELLTKQSRPGRNPRSGESVAIPAKRVVKFRASAALKNRL